MQPAQQIFDPQKNQHSTIKMMVRGRDITQVVVTFTSSLSAFIWGRDISMKYAPEWGGELIGFIGGLIIAAIAAYITDIAFGSVLRDVLFRTFGAKHPNVVKHTNMHTFFTNFQKGELVMKWMLLIILLAFDIYMMAVITDPIAEKAGTRQETDIAALRSELQSQFDAEVADLKGLSTQAGKAAAKAAAAAKNGNKALVKLASNGNGWAANVINSKATKAAAADERSRVAAETALTQKLYSGADFITQRIADEERKNEEARAKNKRDAEITAGIYTCFTVGMKILCIFFNVLILVSFFAYSYSYNPDITGDGIIDYKDVQAYAQASTGTGSFP